jgi:hypothetical protein
MKMYILKYNILISHFLDCHRRYNFQEHCLHNDHAEFQFSSVSVLHETHNINSLEGAMSVWPLICFTSQ